MSEQEKFVMVPISVVESIINNPGNRDVLSQLRAIAETQHPVKFNRPVKVEVKEEK